MQCAMLWRGALCCATRRGAAAHDAAEWSAAEGKWLKTLRCDAVRCGAPRCGVARRAAWHRAERGWEAVLHDPGLGPLN
jgi:hypothetical protein